MPEVQSISPASPPVSSHEIGHTDPQWTLPVGPTGKVHRSKIPDNRTFWETVNAVEFASRGVTREKVFRTVAYFVSLADARVCFASVETQAKRARLGTTAYRAHLRALERDGYIETDGGRSGGRSATHYRLSTQRVSVSNPTLSVAQPNAQRWVNPTLSVAEEVREEGTEEVQQRTVGKPTETPPDLANKGRSSLRSSPHTAQQRMVAAIAEKLNLPALLTAAGLEDFDEIENTKKQALIKRLLTAEAWHDAKGGKRKKPNTGDRNKGSASQGMKRGSLMEAYAARWRLAHKPGLGGG